MKYIYSYWTLFIFSLSSFSQMITLDETPQIDWPNSPYLKDLVVYDNDILYNISKTANSFNPSVLLNYGLPNTFIDINQNQNQAIRLKMEVPFFLFKQFFDGGYYETGTAIFGQQIPNSNKPSSSVVQLNKSRTMFLPNNYGLKSIEKIAKQTVVGRDTIFDSPNSYYAINMVQPEFQKLIKLPEPIYTNKGTYGSFFLYNNTIHFAVNLTGKSEMFTDDGFGEAKRLTNLQSGTGGTAPIYMTPTSDGIWFSGQNRVSSDTGTIINEGRELCYTNGNVDLNQPPAKGFGYIPYKTGTIDSRGIYTGSVPVVFGKVNDKIIYYAKNTNIQKMFAYPGNVALNIPGFVYKDNNPFCILNDKLYIISSFKTGDFSPNKFRLIEIDGTSSGTEIYELAVQGATNLFVYNDAIYYVGGNKLVKFDPITKKFETIFEASGFLISDVTPYQDGFIFIERENQYPPFSLKLKGWNIEQRQVIHDSQNNANKSKSNLYNLTFKSINYGINLHNINLSIPDNLKIQLLDSSSYKIKFLSPKIPVQNGEINASVMYGINTFTDGNNHVSEISFSYDQAMFPNIDNFDATNLKVNIYQNGTSQTIPSQLDSANKTLTINANFADESFIYFSYSGTLSIDENILKSKLSLFPNPTNNVLYIKIDDNSFIGVVEIFNLLGKKVISNNQFSKQKKEINVSNLSEGIYVVKIKVNDFVVSKKLIIY